MAYADLLSPEFIRQLLDFDPDTGALYWKPRETHHFKNGRMPKTWNIYYAGRRADKRRAKKSGAQWMDVRLYEKSLRAHRVAWVIHHGAWPDGQIDHINGDTCDNRIINLRVVTDQENKRNLPLSVKNKSGVIGVFYSPEKGRKKHWIAAIGINGRAVRLGRFDTKEEAAMVRARATIEYGFHPNHGRCAKRLFSDPIVDKS